jgi:hypothetical protein
MTDLPTYACPLTGVEHELVSEHTRIMRCGDHAFVIACDCGPVALTDADSPPQEEPDQFVNPYGGQPTPEQWLALETAADGWYATTAFEMPDDPAYDGTHGQRRAQLREQMQELADTDDGRDLGPSRRERAARGVECPDCGASTGSKCQRPSGHTVRTVHADRVDAAAAAGVIKAESDDDRAAEATNQTALTGWSE